MNYYAPRELKDPATGEPSGLWHYTVMNDGRVRAVGYCADKENLCTHTTPEAASDCYKRYIREQRDGKLPGGFPLSDDDEKTRILEMTSSY